MPAVAIEIADAIVTELNAGAFSQAVHATRRYLPVVDLTDLNTVALQVVPATEVITLSSRSTNEHEYGTDIAIQKKLQQEEETEATELDGLMQLVQEIADYMTRRNVANASWTNTARTVLYSPEHLDERRTFTAVVRVTHHLNRSAA